jgi:hypothetical protein
MTYFYKTSQMDSRYKVEFAFIGASHSFSLCQEFLC